MYNPEVYKKKVNTLLDHCADQDTKFSTVSNTVYLYRNFCP